MADHQSQADINDIPSLQRGHESTSIVDESVNISPSERDDAFRDRDTGMGNFKSAEENTDGNEASDAQLSFLPTGQDSLTSKHVKEVLDSEVNMGTLFSKFVLTKSRSVSQRYSTV